MKYAIKILIEERNRLKPAAEKDPSKRSDVWIQLRDLNAAIDILSSIERAHPR